MGKKLPELCVERVLLTGRCAGGEHFFIMHIADLTATYLMEQGTSEVENGHPKSK